MKKVISILVPIIAVALVLVGCGKSSTVGEKKTVSEVDQLLTKKGQIFEDEPTNYQLTVGKPKYLKAVSKVNNDSSYISIKKAGKTQNGKYNIYKLSSGSSGSYSSVNGEYAVIDIKNGYLIISMGRKKTITNENYDSHQKSNENMYGGSLLKFKIKD